MKRDGLPPESIRKRGRPVNADSTETRNRILTAAREVINERGYQAATFQAISVAANLSRPSLHYYFASREEIYETLVAEANVVMADCIGKAQVHDTAIARLCALVAAVSEADLRDGSQIAFLVSARLEGMRNPELRLPGGTGLRDFLTTVVRDATAAGELPADTSTSAVVDMLLAVILGLGFYAGFIEGATNTAVTTRRLERLFSHGLLDGVGAPDSANDTFGDTPRTVVEQP